VSALRYGKNYMKCTTTWDESLPLARTKLGACFENHVIIDIVFGPLLFPVYDTRSENSDFALILAAKYAALNSNLGSQAKWDSTVTFLLWQMGQARHRSCYRNFLVMTKRPTDGSTVSVNIYSFRANKQWLYMKRKASVVTYDSLNTSCNVIYCSG
jgi:hypothetical protein